ncbi:MAG: dienelactone hydrolase family protein, partial [Desulfobacteraceae bacterium]|nr:dienelactone hydrolase family protein [Desulfobacteraceae bacterium]
MQIIIASDIFGRTSGLEELAAGLSSNSRKTIMLDPYRGQYMDFINEKEAYAYFQKNIGIEQYKDTISTIIKKTMNSFPNDSLKNLLLIGFSVGASAIWGLSDKFSNNEKIKAVCFYGSQIRYSLNISPKIEMDLIFPEDEPHFNVKDLLTQLSCKKNVNCNVAPYLHGFMN